MLRAEARSEARAVAAAGRATRRADPARRPRNFFSLSGPPLAVRMMRVTRVTGRPGDRGVHVSTNRMPHGADTCPSTFTGGLLTFPAQHLRQARGHSYTTTCTSILSVMGAHGHARPTPAQATQHRNPAPHTARHNDTRHRLTYWLSRARAPPRLPGQPIMNMSLSHRMALFRRRRRRRSREPTPSPPRAAASSFQTLPSSQTRRRRVPCPRGLPPPAPRACRCARAQAARPGRPAPPSPGRPPSISRLYLIHISSISRLYLVYISATSRLYLVYISAISRLYLVYISATSRLYLAPP